MAPRASWPPAHVEWAEKRDALLLAWHAAKMLLLATWSKAASRDDKIAMVLVVRSYTHTSTNNKNFTQH
jgi:hypothetical protein